MTVTVKPGDSLSAILKRANVPGWNTPAVWNTLASQLRSKNPSRIYPGEVIDLSPVLPQSAKPAPVAAPTPAPVAPVAQQAGAQAAKEVVPQAPFSQVMPWEQFFDSNLAKSSAAQRSARYYDPLVQQGREGVESEFAGRNLTRSGARGTGVMDMYKDFADKEASMREQLYGTQEGEAKRNYGFQQGLYEESPKGYKATPYKMEPYQYQYPAESAQRYSKSYRDWLKSAFKM